MTFDHLMRKLDRYVATNGRAPSAIRLTEDQYRNFLGLIMEVSRFKDDLLKPGEAPRFCGVPVYCEEHEMGYDYE